MIRSALAFFIAIGSVIAPIAPVSPAPCALAVGTPVTLRSTDFDPDVFVWDTRQRAIEYAGGHWKNTSDVMNHTLLAKPGTRAIVVACEAGSAQSRYANALEDTVGLKITAGPYRGKFGWVTAEDIHSPSLRH